MNILYIGPYRHDSDYGILSRLYLENIINTKHNVTCRPLYFGAANIDRNLQELSHYENNINNSYDVLIQHCPMDWAQNHGGFKKNIVIPIIGNICNLRDYQKDALCKFDQIVVDNDNHESLMVRSGCASNLHRISCPIVKSLCDNLKDKKINLGIHNNSKKFYLFGNIQKDTELLQKILVAFYVSFRAEYGKSMIFFLEEAPQNEQQNFYNMVNSIKNNLNILHSDKSISELFVFKNLSFQEKIVAHNTCDILLSFGTEFRSTIQEQHAKYFHNSIINIENTETVEVPSFRNIANYFPGDRENSILTQSLIEKMTEFGNKDTKSEQYNIQTFNTLASIL